MYSAAAHKPTSEYLTPKFTTKYTFKIQSPIYNQIHLYYTILTKAPAGIAASRVCGLMCYATGA